MKKISLTLFLVLTLAVVLSGCINYQISVPGEQGQAIITADEALEAVEEEGTILVDAQKSSGYKESHIEGSVNISRNDITTLMPFPNMLASADKIAGVLGENGISNNSRVMIYDDNNNMDAARLWWTMKVYGHEEVQVVSGGINALEGAGAETTTEPVEVDTVEYEPESKNTDMIATKEEVLKQVNDPSDDVALLDVRTESEYSSGTIPDSVHINYTQNNMDNGTYKSIDKILDLYPEEDIVPDKTIIMFCKTSIRAAQTYVVLYNAGYRDLKIYDGAWVEWSADSSAPVEQPSGKDTEANIQDGS